MRRQGAELLLKARKEAYRTEKRKPAKGIYPFPQSKLTYLGNVYNAKARKFYAGHGVPVIAYVANRDTAFVKKMLVNGKLRFIYVIKIPVYALSSIVVYVR